MLTDKDGECYKRSVASKDGMLSSIFDFDQHGSIWLELGMSGQITLKSATLATLLKINEVEVGLYKTLVMDVQGSELLVLRGAEPFL